MNTVYNQRYSKPDLYWGSRPSSMAHRVLESKPPTSQLRLLDIGCGEGKDSIFFARNGYQVSVFDAAEVGIVKAREIASGLNLEVDFQVSEINEYRPQAIFDIVFSSGTLQYLKPNLRKPFIDNLKKQTTEGGIHVLHTFISKPFLDKAPDAEESESLWSSGELMSLYHDWQIEWSLEEIKDCSQGRVKSFLDHLGWPLRLFDRLATEPISVKFVYGAIFRWSKFHPAAPLNQECGLFRAAAMHR